jgi:phosphatidylinositol-3-phosphatase
MKKIAVLAASVLAVVVAVTSASASAPRKDLKNFQHVWVVMMENTSDHSLIGNKNAPYINELADTVGYATNYYGVAHPSQPNYVAITSGSTNGVADDNDTTVNATNIVDQLESHGKTWRDYQQSLSLCNGNKFAHACGNQLYERKHNPFVSYTDVASSAARMANVVDLDQLQSDLWSGNAPDYSFIAPDQCHDMHGRAATPADDCDFSNEQKIITAGDTFLQGLVNEITSSPAWNGNSAIFIVWDESDFTNTPPFNAPPFGFGDTSGCCDANPGGGHVLGLVLSHSDHSARESSVAYNHYSVLATIEDGWKLGCLANTCDTANVTPMSDLVGPQG